MSFNPLAIILNQNKLIGPNYVNWKRNLDIILTAEGYKYVLTKERPDLPVANTPRAYLERYEKWLKDNDMAHCYILALISSTLQHQLKYYLSGGDMILSLKKMFREQGRPARKITMRTLMNTKIAEGTLVREYVFKMFDHLNTLEILGGEIDVECQIDIILESLPDFFN